MRAFVAVPAEGEEALRRLRGWLARLDGIRGLRTVPAHQLHFTLKFFEDLPAGRVGAVRAALSRVAASSAEFSLSLGRLGVFPPFGPARVLWVGIGAGAGALAALAATLEQECASEGFSPEPRPFSPHLTLARVKEPRAARAAADFASSETAAGGILDVRELVLFQSVLGASGAAHTPLARLLLGGPAWGLRVR